MGLAGPNCWTPMHAKFTAALVASATFRAMIGLDGSAADAAVAGRIFGNRVTHSKDGRVWTRDELAELRHYAAIFDDPDAPYGKHLDAATNGCYRPHGTTAIYLWRLIPDQDLIQDNDGRTHTTDAQDDEWRQIAGGVLSDVIDWMIENGGPRITNAEVEDVATTRTDAHNTQGCGQGCTLVFQWREE